MVASMAALMRPAAAARSISPALSVALPRPPSRSSSSFRVLRLSCVYLPSASLAFAALTAAAYASCWRVVRASNDLTSWSAAFCRAMSWSTVSSSDSVPLAAV